VFVAKGWHRDFNDPIPLPAGGELRTLRDPDGGSETIRDGEGQISARGGRFRWLSWLFVKVTR